MIAAVSLLLVAMVLRYLQGRFAPLRAFYRPWFLVGRGHVITSAIAWVAFLLGGTLLCNITTWWLAIPLVFIWVVILRWAFKTSAHKAFPKRYCQYLRSSVATRERSYRRSQQSGTQGNETLSKTDEEGNRLKQMMDEGLDLVSDKSSPDETSATLAGFLDREHSPLELLRLHRGACILVAGDFHDNYMGNGVPTLAVDRKLFEPLDSRWEDGAPNSSPHPISSLLVPPDLLDGNPLNNRAFLKWALASPELEQPEI